MLSFCQSCSNLYTYTNNEDQELIMKCHGCGRPEKDITKQCVYFNQFVKSSYDIRIDPDLCHDHTLPNTDQEPCLNKETCPSNNLGYKVYVEDRFQELKTNEGEKQAEEIFWENGGPTAENLTEGWLALTEEQRNSYNNQAQEQEITETVPPRIVFFHYNKDMKLAFICCLCKTYWQN